MSIVYGIVGANQYGWTDARTLGFMAGGVALLVVFVVIESRVADPLVRLGIFRVRTLRAADLTMLIVSGGMFSVFFFASLYVQEVLGFSPLRAGLGFLPLTAAIIFSAGLAQRVIGPLGIKMTALIGADDGGDRAGDLDDHLGAGQLHDRGAARSGGAWDSDSGSHSCR